MMSWPLRFFGSGEEQVVLENLSDLRKAHKTHNPDRKDLYAAFKLTPFNSVKVVIMGQDPYPSHKQATGLAFSIPEDMKEIPPTLQNIFKEYCEDLHYPFPSNGSLTKWASEGVFLWNATPTCEAGKASSHSHWPEWKVLTQEIVETLSPSGVVFVFLGGKAQWFTKFVNQEVSHVIELAHPSPLGKLNPNAKHPFHGSRLFSTINDRLNQLGRGPVNWRLA